MTTALPLLSIRGTVVLTNGQPLQLAAGSRAPRGKRHGFTTNQRHLPVGESLVWKHHLCKNRARLAERLLASLEDLSEEENARLWSEEAARRDVEWDQAGHDIRSADEVFRDARARLK